MTAKAQIVQQLGETEIVLPELLAAALEANDRAKVRMTLLQEAVIHAENPASRANTLDRERRSAGLGDAILNSTVKNARALGSGRFDIPGGQMLLKGLYSDIEVMLAPVISEGGETAEAASKRLKALRASSPEAQGDVMTQAAVTRITSARAGVLDSEHLLIMDLHKALNRLSAAMATEIIAGAQVHGLEPHDKHRIEAFMRGIERTRALALATRALEPMRPEPGNA